VVIDTSAIVAMLTEPGGPAYGAVVVAASTVAMSALNVYETRLVLTGRRPRAPRFAPAVLAEFHSWLDLLQVDVVPFDIEQAILAHHAYQRFGKGFHAAALNLADCAAYALAKLRRESLLFKGEDFAQTDVEAALGSA
jgi:ribonuclease VapC